jgi:hypothetical protein
MKHLFLALALAAFLGGCAALNGTYSYIPIGPQNLSVQITDAKQIPVYITRGDIKRPWGAIGLIRVKNLPNDRAMIARERDRIKTAAAGKGAQAIILNQYFEEEAGNAYPVTMAAYLVRFLDDVSPQDQQRIQDFATEAAIENAR